ncbi:hypothetical protein [Consotaella salsifontis]|uniref:Phage integrase family protein n=1 Tax=Consotaella salsifontis TaxID=1365950 RepID=A0A1T4SU15_9HYPH|nr:hypothetical protein [Consotaella salsifontis]SKA31780.1 hypothetical protein SAMN05428963_11457 [Consotaella salsifontis]
MPTEKVRLGPAAQKRALAEADGRHASSQALSLTDPGRVGLSIRVSGHSAGWFLKWSGTFKRLAPVGHPDTKSEQRKPGVLYTVTDADALAGEIRERMKEGLEVDVYLKARLSGQSAATAAAKGASFAAERDGAWRWPTLVDRYIAEHVAQPKVKANGRLKPASAKTIKDTELILRHPEVTTRFGKMLVRDIQKVDMEGLRDAWWAAGHKARQRKLVIYTKAAFKWTKKHHAAAHLDDIAPWWLELTHHTYATEATLAEMDGQPPIPPLTAAQVATLLDIAERHRIKPDRKIRLETSEIALAALWWVALTAQRTHAAYNVITDRIEDRTDTDGWYEVSWLPSAMKSGRPFALPIPEEVFERTLARALLDPHRRPDSLWVFPSSRTKLRDKDGHADKPIGDTILNSLLNRLRGKDGDRTDLLAAAGLPHFTLHDLRKAMTSHLATHTGLPAATASAILDHAPTELDPAAREAQVTRDHYNKSQRLNLKYRGLQAWADAVLGEYEKIVERRRKQGLGRRLRHPPQLPMQAPPRRQAERAQAELERRMAQAAEEAKRNRPPVMLDLGKLTEAAPIEEGFVEEAEG